jgi:threonine dehydratase
MTINIDAIREAAQTIAGDVVRTPSVAAPALSAASGADVVLKLENMQITGSFKPRGALVKLSSLDKTERRGGVVAASAGNHAQGVAHHARRLGIGATIVMPHDTPFNKVDRTKADQATVVLHGETLSESRDHAVALAEKQGAVFVSPYDDERIIVGQGTIGLEMLADDPDLEVLIIPIGGGGLISGIATAATAINPKIEIVGVQTALYPSMVQALAGETPTSGGQTVAEGIAVKAPGILTTPIVKRLVSDILLVEETAIETAVQTYLQVQRIVAEGAGAASLAALMENRSRFEGRRVGLVVSGGNIDARLLSFILLRGLAREGRIVRLRIQISDMPGLLAKVSSLIGDAGGNIVEVYHQRLYYDVPVKQAELDVVVETLDALHVQRIVENLTDAGFRVRQLSGTTAGDSG